MSECLRATSDGKREETFCPRLSLDVKSPTSFFWSQDLQLFRFGKWRNYSLKRLLLVEEVLVPRNEDPATVSNVTPHSQNVAFRVPPLLSLSSVEVESTLFAVFHILELNLGE